MEWRGGEQGCGSCEGCKGSWAAGIRPPLLSPRKEGSGLKPPSHLKAGGVPDSCAPPGLASALTHTSLLVAPTAAEPHLGRTLRTVVPSPLPDPSFPSVSRCSHPPACSCILHPQPPTLLGCQATLPTAAVGLDDWLLLVKGVPDGLRTLAPSLWLPVLAPPQGSPG